MLKPKISGGSGGTLDFSLSLSHSRTSPAPDPTGSTFEIHTEIRGIQLGKEEVYSQTWCYTWKSQRIQNPTPSCEKQNKTKNSEHQIYAESAVTPHSYCSHSLSHHYFRWWKRSINRLPKPAPVPPQSLSAARVILWRRQSDHVPPLLHPFQWGPRLLKVEDKMLIKAGCPPRLSTCICPYIPPCSLCSSPTGFLSGANLYWAFLGSRSCAKYFTGPVSMNSNENPTRWIMLLFSFCRGGNQGLERFRNAGKLLKPTLTYKHLYPFYIHVKNQTYWMIKQGGGLL